MLIMHSPEILKGIRVGIALGNFDGPHVGHISLVNTLINRCKMINLKSVIYTFENHPIEILKPEVHPSLLCSVNKKMEVFSTTSIDYVYLEVFDKSMSTLAPEKFIRDILLKKFDIALIVVGFNYSFGYDGIGSIKRLREFGAKYNFEVIVIPPIKIDDRIISSSHIRNLISSGNIEVVPKFLGRYYSLDAKIIAVHDSILRLGLIGPFLMPKIGAYLAKVKVNDTVFDCIANIESYNDIVVKMPNNFHQPNLSPINMAEIEFISKEI